MKAALLEHKRGLRLHDLRHTYVSLLSSRGAHTNVIAEHRGHSTGATTDPCRHPHDDLHDTTADLLDPVWTGGPAKADAAPRLRVVE